MTTTWQLDNIHSYIGFKIKMLGIAAIHGQFKEYAGTFKVSNDNWENTEVNVEASIASIDTGIKLRDEHLQDEYWFDAAKFPKWSFQSESFIKIDDEKYELKGNLTLKGITKAVVFKLKLGGFATDKDGFEKVGFSGEAKIIREDFGIAPNAQLPNGNLFLAKKIKIEIDFQLQKETV